MVFVKLRIVPSPFSGTTRKCLIHELATRVTVNSKRNNVIPAVAQRTMYVSLFQPELPELYAVQARTGCRVLLLLQQDKIVLFDWPECEAVSIIETAAAAFRARQKWYKFTFVSSLSNIFRCETVSKRCPLNALKETGMLDTVPNHDGAGLRRYARKLSKSVLFSPPVSSKSSFEEIIRDQYNHLNSVHCFHNDQQVKHVTQNEMWGEQCIKLIKEHILLKRRFWERSNLPNLVTAHLEFGTIFSLSSDIQTILSRRFRVVASFRKAVERREPALIPFLYHAVVSSSLTLSTRQHSNLRRILGIDFQVSRAFLIKLFRSSFNEFKRIYLPKKLCIISDLWEKLDSTQRSDRIRAALEEVTEKATFKEERFVVSVLKKIACVSINNESPPIILVSMFSNPIQAIFGLLIILYPPCVSQEEWFVGELSSSHTIENEFYEFMGTVDNKTLSLLLEDTNLSLVRSITTSSPGPRAHCNFP